VEDCNSENSNVKAFLKLIRYAEHYPDTSDAFYDTLYGGGRFSGYSTHPNKAVTRWGHTSTAAGAYQILYPTWAEAKKRGIVSDFRPASQDLLATEKLRSRGALNAVCDGDLAAAFRLLRNEWTSLPGAKQTRMTFDIAKTAFIGFGGTAK
jgi:lysozyme